MLFLMLWVISDYIIKCDYEFMTINFTEYTIKYMGVNARIHCLDYANILIKYTGNIYSVYIYIN